MGIGKGTLQQYLLLDKSAPVARKPPELSFPEAAATPLVYTTVHDALVKWGKLPFDPPPNEVGKRSVLILGGSSGTGHVAIQLGKKMGLRVVTTCSTRNVSFVKSLGADEVSVVRYKSYVEKTKVIDYTQEHVPEAALMSPYAPFAVILDCVGGTEMLGHLDYLLLEDRAAPQLGIYITIVGDSESNLYSLQLTQSRNWSRCDGWCCDQCKLSSSMSELTEPVLLPLANDPDSPWKTQ